MLSSLWTGATTSSIIYFKDMSRSQDGSFKGILCPIMNGNSRIRAQFSLGPEEKVSVRRRLQALAEDS